MDPLWLQLLDFTGAHHGAISVPEAAELGIPPYRLAKWTTAGRLERPAPGLYLIAGVPDSWHRHVRVATGSRSRVGVAPHGGRAARRSTGFAPAHDRGW